MKNNQENQKLSDAVRKKNLHGVLTALGSGANVDGSRERFTGSSPLIQSILAGEYRIAIALATGGAKIDEKNNLGYTALDYAKRAKNPNLHDTLKNIGALSKLGVLPSTSFQRTETRLPRNPGYIVKGQKNKGIIF